MGNHNAWSICGAFLIDFGQNLPSISRIKSSINPRYPPDFTQQFETKLLISFEEYGYPSSTIILESASKNIKMTINHNKFVDKSTILVLIIPVPIIISFALMDLFAYPCLKLRREFLSDFFNLMLFFYILTSYTSSKSVTEKIYNIISYRKY